MKPTNTDIKRSINKNFVPIVLCLLLILGVFVIDLQLPLGVAGGAPYVAVILVSLWFQNYKYVISLAIICSFLILIGFYFSPPGGELWKVVANRALSLFVIWVTVILAIKWEITIKKHTQIKYDAEKKKEKEQIYIATMHAALHITNNLLNQLKLVGLEIENNPDFDKDVCAMFDGMQIEAGTLLKALSSVENIEVETIIQSVHPKKNA